MNETIAFYPSAHTPVPIRIRRRWVWTWGIPANGFISAIAASVAFVNIALLIAERHPIGALGSLLVVPTLLAIATYHVATAYRRSKTLLLNADGITLRQGRAEQRCKWEQVTRLRCADEAIQSGAVVSRLYIERGNAAPLVLNDEWTVPQIGLLARMSEWHQHVVGTAIPTSADGLQS